jgi:general secretion pathway protein G
MYRSSSRKSGFTLVEILIVVIILGILAAIVIPQFTNASTEARENSVRSMVQTLRSQVELFKLQHGDQYPTTGGTLATAWDWTDLTGVTTFGGNSYGPYLQATPQNSLRSSATGMFIAAAELTPGAAVTGAAGTDGFVVTPTGKIFAIDAAGNALD